MLRTAMIRAATRWIPARFERLMRIQRERIRLSRLVRLEVKNEAALTRTMTTASLAALFSGSAEIATEWNSVAPELAELGITDRADGINPGDRRALYYLLRVLRPRAVLEIGTHIGASTVHIARALRGTPGAFLVSVDINDVNDSTTQPWLRFGAKMSPRELVTRVGMGESARFVTSRSTKYLANAQERFDFIFLDGDHSAQTVYQELPQALRVLNRGGVILIHDYFPHMKPLWPDGIVLPGSWLALQRLRNEGAHLQVLPLGDLPWQTKQGSQRTSLAVVVGS